MVLADRADDAASADRRPGRGRASGPHAIAVPRDVLPEPRREDRSLIRSVIDTTSGPIGRRLVALAGVLLAVVIGILCAATIDDRTQLVRKIQEHRHVDEH